MKAEIQESLLNFISRNFMVEISDIILDRSLIDEGIIDSFGLIEISSFIETEYGVYVEEDEMNRDNFGSVLRIVDYIERKSDAGRALQKMH